MTEIYHRVLLPYAAKRAGSISFTIIMPLFSLISYFTCVLTFETTRLLLGNYKMKQKTDYESLISSNMTSNSIAVLIGKQLHLL
jgi:hypothetical protein